MKILLTGGGTMGSVTPLVAVMDELKKDGGNHQFLWIGTKTGPEKEFIESNKIEFRSIQFGKLRRYFSVKNFTDIFRIKIGVIQSFFIIIKFKPDIILSAGSFVSVPVVFAGWLLSRPILIHQMDIKPGLANKIMSIFANKITVAFKKSLDDYPASKTVWTGSPTRSHAELGLSKEKLRAKFNLSADLPVLLVLGGGTGAMAINNLLVNHLNEITEFCQIIHITGKGKNPNVTNNPRYQSYEFLTDISPAYNVADAVLSRAGLGVLSELATLKKPAIIIPIPGSHQEENADMFLEAGAALLINQEKISSEEITEKIKKIMYNETLRAELSENIGKMMKKDAAQNVVKIIKEIAK